MMVHSKVVMECADKFIRLRRPDLVSDNVVPLWLKAKICTKLGKRLYERGHSIIDYEYGSRK
jgi:hypothetical protein